MEPESKTLSTPYNTSDKHHSYIYPSILPSTDLFYKHSYSRQKVYCENSHIYGQLFTEQVKTCKQCWPSKSEAWNTQWSTLAQHMQNSAIIGVICIQAMVETKNLENKAPALSTDKNLHMVGAENMFLFQHELHCKTVFEATLYKVRGYFARSNPLPQ